MKLQSLKNSNGARKSRKRVGRGSGSGLGKTCGKGQKGQMARTGHKHKATFEGGQMRLVQRVPIRGFHNYNRVNMLALNVMHLEAFPDGADVTLETLRAAGMVSGPQTTKVKVLGDGELSKKLTVHAHAFSASARSKIEAAGGSCQVVK